MENFNTPILFIIFNRESTAQRVFNKIKEIKPKKLYVAADGPRQDNLYDKEHCPKVRNIIKQVDWDCELKTLFRDKNLGCGKAVSGAIDWLFENEEKGIILEDDVLPNNDFFVYCDDLLERYKNQDKIKVICGNNFGIHSNQKNISYWYSSFLHVWGWATWKRAWKSYEYDLNKFTLKELREAYKPYSFSYESELYWNYRAKQMQKGVINTWDYQASFWIFLNKGLCIQPMVPLVTNIGTQIEEQTHSFANAKDMVYQSQSILPLKYNDNIVRDKQADKTYHLKYNKKSLWKYPLLHIKLLFK